MHRQLTPAQQERRLAVIEAAMELATNGGYEAVVIKDVAARAGVSLGTLYRYFSSKDHLLAEALQVWSERLGRKLQASPPRGNTPAARVAALWPTCASNHARLSLRSRTGAAAKRRRAQFPAGPL